MQKLEKKAGSNRGKAHRELSFSLVPFTAMLFSGADGFGCYDAVGPIAN